MLVASRQRIAREPFAKSLWVGKVAPAPGRLIWCRLHPIFATGAAMIKPRRVGHATFETADIEKQIAYWTDVAGLVLAERENKRAYLATKTGLLVVQLEQSDKTACTRLSFEVAPNSDFGELAKALAADGIKSELRNDSTPGIGPVLTFKDNKGTTIALF
jgi:catechol 2,3-dioxygenase-like lactoylglutathione lyase family enzyme